MYVLNFLFSIIVYVISLILITSIFLSKRSFGLHDLVKSFLLSTLVIIILSALNYFVIQINLLPIILLDLIGLTQVKKFKFLTLSSQEKRVLIGIAIYGLIFLLYYSTFATFLAGDIITHASFIRMILNHDPIRIPLINSYITDYPKGFHFFASFFASSIGIIDSIKLTSVLSLTVTLLIIYLIAKKLDVHPEGAVLISAIFLPHYFYIFWGGYTSQLAILFILFAILFTLNENRIYLILSFLFIFIIHPRAFLFFVPFAIAYLFSKRRITFITIILSAITFFTLYYLIQYGFSQYAFFFYTLLQDKQYLLKLVIVFIPAILSIPGYFLCENKILRRWFIVAIPFLYLMDRVMAEHGDPRRLLEIYYLLFSLISANVLKTKYKSLVVIFLLVYGSSLMLYEFNKYQKTFAISNSEIGEFDIASTYINSTDIINLDQICEWFYPLENIKISHPRAIENMKYNKELYSVTEELLHGNSIDGSYNLCISRYSIFGEKTPFIYFEKIPLPNVTTTYNGSLIKIMHLNEHNQ